MLPRMSGLAQKARFPNEPNPIIGQYPATHRRAYSQRNATSGSTRMARRAGT